MIFFCRRNPSHGFATSSSLTELDLRPISPIGLPPTPGLALRPGSFLALKPELTLNSAPINSISLLQPVPGPDPALAITYTNEQLEDS